MSYEGYVQYLCRQGHYWTADCYCEHNESTSCPVCSSLPCWHNQVDLTNGSFCDATLTQPCEGCEYCDKGRIDNYVELEVFKEAVYETCSCCGAKKKIEEERYIIPTDKGYII